MTLTVFSLFVIPLWIVFFSLYFRMKQGRMFRESLLAKCGGSFLGVTSAALALSSQGGAGETAFLSSPLFWALVFFTAADALLEISFLPGMGVFALGHVLLIVSLLPAGSFLWSAVFWAAAMLLAAFLFRRELPRMGRTAIAAVLYVAFLSTVLALALPLPFLGRNGVGAGSFSCVCLALGALCFFISDLMVAKMHFSHLDEKWDKPVMILYWAALYLLSASLW